MEPAPGAGKPGMPEPAGTLPATGDAGVDDAVRSLGDLGALPVADHPAIFEEVHRRLAEALGEMDGHGAAPRGDDPAGPGR